MAQKGKAVEMEEFDGVGDVGPAPHAKIHGVVASVSPMKQGKKSEVF